MFNIKNYIVSLKKFGFGEKAFVRHGLFFNQIGCTCRDFGFWVVAGAAKFVENFRCVAEL